MPDIKKLGIISGMMSECVNMGSLKRGMAKKEGQSQPCYEENPWVVAPKIAFMTGRLTTDNLDSLIEMVDKKVKENTIMFPGLSVVYT